MRRLNLIFFSSKALNRKMTTKWFHQKKKRIFHLFIQNYLLANERKLIFFHRLEKLSIKNVLYTLKQ